MATSTWGVRERVLLAIVVILAVIVGLLLRRHRWSGRRLAAERRQLSVAVNNIPQGLVLYDSSARIIICNQPYIEMFGLSPEVARQGCSMQRLIQHRKETGSFDGDVDAFCKAIIRNVSLGRATRQFVGFAVTGTLHAVAGMALMLAVVLHWRADLWPVHAPANAR